MIGRITPGAIEAFRHRANRLADALAEARARRRRGETTNAEVERLVADLAELRADAERCGIAL
jgi:F0F1-type ATP synthase membrane subunit b/b'